MLSVLQEDVANLNPFSIQMPATAAPPKVASLAQRCRKFSSGGYLDLVPSTLDLMYVAVGSASGNVATLEARYAAFMADARANYDVILIDCHPAGSILTKTSLGNSDDVLVPVVTHQFAARGISLMKTFIQASRPTNPPVMHVLFNMTARRGASSVETGLRADVHFSKYCLRSSLKKFKAFADPHEGEGFVGESSAPYSTEAFSNISTVTTEIAKRLLDPKGV